MVMPWARAAPNLAGGNASWRRADEHARARIGYAICVAIAAFVWQFVYFKPHGLILMLAAASITVPIINRRWQQRRFEWAHARA